MGITGDSADPRDPLTRNYDFEFHETDVRQSFARPPQFRENPFLPISLLVLVPSLPPPTLGKFFACKTRDFLKNYSRPDDRIDRERR